MSTAGTSSATDVDTPIIGAGPAGLFAAYYAGFRGISVAVMDSLPEPGGQISAMYPEKHILDIAGFPAIRGRELVQRLLEQAEPHDPVYLLGRHAQHLQRNENSNRPDTFTVTTSTGTAVHARSIIVTGGIGKFTPGVLPAAQNYTGGPIGVDTEFVQNYAKSA